MGAGNGLQRTDGWPWDSAFGKCGITSKKKSCSGKLCYFKLFIELEVKEALQKDNDVPLAGAAGCAHRDGGVTTFKVGCRIRAGIQGCLVLVVFREVGNRGRGFLVSCAHLCDSAHVDRQTVDGMIQSDCPTEGLSIPKVTLEPLDSRKDTSSLR